MRKAPCRRQAGDVERFFQRHGDAEQWLLLAAAKRGIGGACGVSCAIEIANDDGIDSPVQRLDAGDRMLDQLRRGNLARVQGAQQCADRTVVPVSGHRRQSPLHHDLHCLASPCRGRSAASRESILVSNMRREKVRSAMPSEPLTASARLADSKSGIMQFCARFARRVKPSLRAGYPPRGAKFFNDLYCAWGCFRVFLSSVLRDRGLMRIDGLCTRCCSRGIGGGEAWILTSMFALTFLGTSASVPSTERNHPSLLVEAAGKRVLIDCGEGTQRQLLRSGAGFRRLDRILLTHAHLDHVLGIPGLFSTLGLRQTSEMMTIHGGQVTLDFVIRMLAGLWGADRAPIPVEFAALTEGQVIDVGDFTIDCFPVRHRDTDSFGFGFKSSARRHLQSDRLAALGVPDGPLRGELAHGRPVIIEGGRTIDPEEVLGPPSGGRKLVVIGDTETTEGLSKYVVDADLLVVEATFLDRDAATARDYGHLTAREAASFAAANNIGQLVLNHVSGRYRDEEILAEAIGIFPNTRVAADFDHIVI